VAAACINYAVAVTHQNTVYAKSQDKTLFVCMLFFVNTN